MPILDNITFHKFRGLQNLELKDLGKVNLLVGNNNSGKTTILEGLSIYANPLDIRDWWYVSSNRDREDRFTRTSIIDTIRWLFPQNYDKNTDSFGETDLEQGELVISSQSDTIFPISKLWAYYESVEELRAPRRLARRGNDSEEEDELVLTQGLDIQVKISPTDFAIASQGIDVDIDNHGEVIDSLSFQIWESDPSIRFPRRRAYRIPVGLVTTTSHRSENSQFRLLSEARYQNFKNEILLLLQEIDSDILDIHILSEPSSISQTRVSIQFEHNRLGYAPLSSFGDGIRRLFHIALKLPRAKGGLLLIDELESAIHTEALQSSYRWLVKWCADMDIQIFATTHSLEAVDALLSVTEADDQLVLYRLEPGEDKTHVVRHGWERLKILREELGQEVRW